MFFSLTVAATERTSVDVLQDLIGAFKTRAWSNVCEETTEETTEPPVTELPSEVIDYETKVVPFVYDPPYHHEETTEETTEKQPCDLACGADMQLDETTCLCQCLDPKKYISGDTCICKNNFVNVDGVCCSPCTNAAQQAILTATGTCTCTCKDVDTTCDNRGGSWDDTTCQCLCGTAVLTTEQCCIQGNLKAPGDSCGTNKVVTNACQCDCIERATSFGDNICCGPCIDDDKEAATDEQGECICQCSSDKVPVGDICCDSCDDDKEATTDEKGTCICQCSSDKVSVGDICCEPCDNDKEATTDETGKCACTCPADPPCETNYQKSEQCVCVCAPDCPAGWVGKETAKGGCKCVCASCAVDSDGRPYCPTPSQTTATLFPLFWTERART